MKSKTLFRILSLFSLLALHQAALAGCSGNIVGERTGPEDFVDISDGGCMYTEIMINGKHSFSEECSGFDRGSEHGFSCKDNGKTAISGATYVLRRDAKPICPGEKFGSRYVCVKGCKKHTPKSLIIEPYEC